MKDSCSLKLVTMFGSMVASLRSSTTMGGASALLEDCGIDVAKWLEGATSIAGCRLVGISKTFTRYVQINDDQGEPVPEGLMPS